jgi:fumarate reductase subunit D
VETAARSRGGVGRRDLFALHPAQTESVGWVSVPDPLMSACILGAALLYLRHATGFRGIKDQGKKSRRTARSRESTPTGAAAWMLSSASVCFAALLVKETAIVLPALILALALLMPRGEKGDADFGIRLVWAFRQTLPFLCVTVFYVLMRLNALGGKLGSRTQHLPCRIVLLSWPATLWFYAKVLLWPVRSHAFADPTLADGFSLAGVLLPCLGVVGAVAALTMAVFWAWRKAQRELRDQEAVGVEYALLYRDTPAGAPTSPRAAPECSQSGRFSAWPIHVPAFGGLDAAGGDRVAPGREESYSFVVCGQPKRRRRKKGMCLEDRPMWLGMSSGWSNPE